MRAGCREEVEKREKGDSHWKVREGGREGGRVGGSEDDSGSLSAARFGPRCMSAG